MGMRYWKRNWMVITAMIVHGLWGILLLFTPDPLNCTPMSGTPYGHNQYLSAGLYLFATLASALHIIFPNFERSYWCWASLMPQQTLLMFSAWSSLHAVVACQYADHVPRPFAFILCDQLWPIVGMILHTLALMDWFHWSKLK